MLMLVICCLAILVASFGCMNWYVMYLKGAYYQKVSALSMREGFNGRCVL